MRLPAANQPAALRCAGLPGCGPRRVGLAHARRERPCSSRGTSFGARRLGRCRPTAPASRGTLHPPRPRARYRREHRLRASRLERQRRAEAAGLVRRPEPAGFSPTAVPATSELVDGAVGRRRPGADHQPVARQLYRRAEPRAHGRLRGGELRTLSPRARGIAAEDVNAPEVRRLRAAARLRRPGTGGEGISPEGDRDAQAVGSLLVGSSELGGLSPGTELPREEVHRAGVVTGAGAESAPTARRSPSIATAQPNRSFGAPFAGHTTGASQSQQHLARTRRRRRCRRCCRHPRGRRPREYPR